jgi:hypothetical protein
VQQRTAAIVRAQGKVRILVVAEAFAGWQPGGAPAAYQIKDGRLVTSLGGVDFDVNVHKVNDRYYAARSNEFGHANYEILEVKE